MEEDFRRDACLTKHLLDTRSPLDLTLPTGTLDPFIPDGLRRRINLAKKPGRIVVLVGPTRDVKNRICRQLSTWRPGPTQTKPWLPNLESPLLRPPQSTVAGSELFLCNAYSFQDFQIAPWVPSTFPFRETPVPVARLRGSSYQQATRHSSPKAAPVPLADAVGGEAVRRAGGVRAFRLRAFRAWFAEWLFHAHGTSFSR